MLSSTPVLIMIQQVKVKQNNHQGMLFCVRKSKHCTFNQINFARWKEITQQNQILLKEGD